MAFPSTHPSSFHLVFYQSILTIFAVLPAIDLKEEREAQKEEAANLQNGDGSKQASTLTVTVAKAAIEERKKAKTRFMFNIADGGFTGTHTHSERERNQLSCF